MHFEHCCFLDAFYHKTSLTKTFSKMCYLAFPNKPPPPPPQKEKFAIKLFLVEQERLSHSGDMESKSLKILRRFHCTAKA